MKTRLNSQKSARTAVRFVLLAGMALPFVSCRKAEEKVKRKTPTFSGWKAMCMASRW